MARRFDVREMLRVAVLDERSGTRLYRDLAGRARNDELRRTFADLAEQEKHHEKRFQEMLDALGEAEPAEQYPDEYVDYLEALVVQGVRQDAHEQGARCTDDVEAVSLAIRFEREQLFLQRDIADVLGGEHEHRAILDQIIQEERGHLVTLSKAKRKLTG